MARADQHEVGRGPADLGAGHHRGDMPLLCVLAAHFEAMILDGGGQAHRIALQALLDGLLHFRADVVPRSSLLVPLDCARQEPPSGSQFDELATATLGRTVEITLWVRAVQFCRL